MAQQKFVPGSQGSALTINPPGGASVVVNITGGTVTSDANGSTTVTFPATINSATTYYSQDADTLTVSAKISGSETANGRGGTYGWAARGGAYTSITPSPTAAQVAVPAASLTVTQQSGSSYTFALADAGTEVEGTNASATTFTIPTHASVAFPVGTPINVRQVGAGQITVAAAGGVTLDAPNGAKTAKQYSTVGLVQRVQDEWVVSGDATT